MKTSLIYLLCAATIILTSCGTQQTVAVSGANFQPSEIKEPQIGAPYTQISIQEIRTFNCDNANPTTTVSRSLVQEQTTFFEVAVEAGGLVRGTPIPGFLEAELESKIKAALGSNVGNTFTQTINTTLDTKPGQALYHKISWKETKVKGVIDVVYQNGTAKLNFEKVVGIELFGRTSEPLNCSGQEETQPTPSENTPILPLPSPTLTSISPPLQVGTCPSTVEEAANTFGGSPTYWKRLAGYEQYAWKYGPAPAAPIENFNIPEGMKGDWWNNFKAQSKTGPVRVGYASEATIWCVP